MNETVVIDTEGKPAREMSHLLNAIVAPRPIGWISTISAKGVANIAPHSYTTVFSTSPPTIGFVSSGRKDTLRNVEETGDFVYNVGTEAMLDAINLSSADMPTDEDEFEWIGLSPAPSDLIRSPRLRDSPVSMEAELLRILPIEGSNDTLVLGRVRRIHVAAWALNGDRIDPALFRPPARLAGSQYTLFGEVVSRKRPTWQSLVDAGVQPPTRNGQARD